MDLTALGARLRGFARPRPLLVEVPGSTGVRWAVQSQLRQLGWVAAASAAEADLLVVCGQPGPELAAAIAVVWDELPTPRAQVTITATGDAGDALRAARARLADAALQHRDLASRGPGPADEEMAPGGLCMAERGDDRDGLRLDQLHPVWGPVLTDWPAGLRLELTLQGDVVQAAVVHEVEVRVLDPEASGPREVLDPRAVAADELGRLLSVLGWPVAAERAGWVRDTLVAGGDPGPRLQSLVARVRRSRGVRAATEGVAVHQGTDAAGRMTGLMAAMAGTELAIDRDRPAALEALPILLSGAEVGAARLIVASLPLTPVTARVVAGG